MLNVQPIASTQKLYLFTIGLAIWKSVGGEKLGPKDLRKNSTRTFSPDRLPYGHGPNCHIYNLVFVCREKFDLLECEEYSIRYCTVALQYSRALGLRALVVCNSVGRR